MIWHFRPPKTTHTHRSEAENDSFCRHLFGVAMQHDPHSKRSDRIPPGQEAEDDKLDCTWIGNCLRGAARLFKTKTYQWGRLNDDDDDDGTGPRPGVTCSSCGGSEQGARQLNYDGPFEPGSWRAAVCFKEMIIISGLQFDLSPGPDRNTNSLTHKRATILWRAGRKRARHEGGALDEQCPRVVSSVVFNFCTACS